MNLAHIVDPHPADRIAIYSRSRPTTYGVLRDQIAHLRGGLVHLGVGKGDRVALLCSNGRYFVDMYLAALGVGAVVVPLNPISPAPEIQNELQTVGAKVVVVEPVAAAAWANVDRSTLPDLQHVVSTEPGTVAGADAAFDDLVADVPVDITEVDADDDAVYVFTSGTAGAPRAAMLTHGNLLSNIRQTIEAGPDGSVLPADVVYGVLPLFHIFGLNVVLGTSLHQGATVVLVQRFDPSTALDTIRERGVTVVPGAPPMWLAFSHFDDAPSDSFSGVRLALTGAAKMNEEAMRRLRDRFGVTVFEGYGLTEASPIVTSSAGLSQRIGSVGRVLPGMQVRVVDEDGEDALRGDTGEIWVKGPNVFKGYLGEPEATRRVLDADGWLHTGDIAVTDDDGYLYLVDRAKDLVIVSGFNVYPAEVEDVLLDHPDVVEAGVVGVPHPHTGEAVKAFVVLAAGSTAHEESLISWCLDHLARYKCPSKILFVDELPRNANGKVVRRSLV